MLIPKSILNNAIDRGISGEGDTYHCKYWFGAAIKERQTGERGQGEVARPTDNVPARLEIRRDPLERAGQRQKHTSRPQYFCPSFSMVQKRPDFAFRENPSCGPFMTLVMSGPAPERISLEVERLYLNGDVEWGAKR